MIFCKYEFEPTVWESLKQTIQTEVAPNTYEWNGCSVSEIGHICTQWGSVDKTLTGCVEWDEEGTCIKYESQVVPMEECTQQSPMYAVDILWYGDIPEDFNQYEVFPNPEGIHTFAGLEYLYTERFCQFNPDSPYCNVN